MKTGKVKALHYSKEKHVTINATNVECKENFGVVNDSHAGEGDKQISILCYETIVDFKQKYGDTKGLCSSKFVENIQTEGILLYELPVGTKIQIGDTIQEISIIGKPCYASEGCEIAKKFGSCTMVKQTIFTKVLRGGNINIGDKIEVIEE